jgi:hypothetical protein
VDGDIDGVMMVGCVLQAPSQFSLVAIFPGLIAYEEQLFLQIKSHAAEMYVAVVAIAIAIAVAAGSGGMEWRGRRRFILTVGGSGEEKTSVVPLRRRPGQSRETRERNTTSASRRGVGPRGLTVTWGGV